MRPLVHAAPSALAALLRDTPLSDGKVAFAWSAAVGAAVERATAVKLDGTTLYVDVATGPWAREIRRSSSLILHRLQTLLGSEAVNAIEVRSRQA